MKKTVHAESVSLKGTTIRADLVRAAQASGTNLTHNEAKVLVDLFFDEIRSALVSGENVLLSGFGKFSVRAKAPRAGRNPNTGKPYPIVARRVVTFRAAPRVRRLIRGKW